MIDIYNDFISDRIKKALVNEASIKDNIIHDVKGPHLDLDKNGTTYKITIEEDKD
mgnify:CR=1 FL=1